MNRLLLWIILGVAALLRFYRLDSPAMWWDEILVPLTAHHSWEYLVGFSLGPEMHPPYFGGIIKLLLNLSSSEFALRSLSALAGTATVGIIFLTGRTVAGTGAGLVAAAFLMANPYMLWLSRQVRPYALLLLALSLVFYFVSKLETDNSKKTWLQIGVISGIQLLLHYVSLFLVFAQSLALAIGMAAERKFHSEKRNFCLYLATVSTFFLAVIPFFLVLMHNRSSSFKKDGHGFGEAYVVLRTKFVELSQIFPGWNTFHIDLLLIFLGAMLLLVSRKKAAIVINCVVFIPVAILFYFKDDYVYFWHVSFLVPAFALMFATGTCWVLRNQNVQKIAVLALVLVSLIYVGKNGEKEFYSSNSHGQFATGPYSKLARLAAREFLTLPYEPGYPRLIYSDSIGFLNSVSWYLNEFCSSNPLVQQRIRFADKTRTVWYLASGVPNATSLVPKTHSSIYASNQLFQCGNVVQYKPFFRISGENPSVSWNVDPVVFYENVTELEDVTIINHMGPAAVPTRNDSFGRFRLAALNETGKAHSVFIDIDRANSGKGNVFEFAVGFDQEPPRTIYHEEGAQEPGGRHVKVRLETPKEYSLITFEARMKAADRTADYEGGNQQTIKVQRIAMLFDAPGLLFDLLKPATLPAGTTFHGVEGIEKDGKGAWRWMTGPEAEFEIESPEDCSGVLSLRMSNPIAHQGLCIYVNGMKVGERHGIPYGKWLESSEVLDVPVALRGGGNQVRLVFDKWNHQGPEQTFAPADPRTLSAALTGLSVTKP